MDGHDAHGVLPLGVQRSGSLLQAAFHHVPEAPGDAHRAQRGFFLQLADHAHGLHQVAQNRRSFRSLLLKPGCPAAVQQHALQHLMQGTKAQSSLSLFHDLRGVGQAGGSAGAAGRSFPKVTGKLAQALRKGASAPPTSLLVNGGCQPQQVICPKGKSLAGKGLEQELAVQGVGNGAQQGGGGLHLRREGEQGPACDHAVEPLVPHGLGIQVGVGGRAQEQHHVRKGVAPFVHATEVVRNPQGLHLKTVFRLRLHAIRREGQLQLHPGFRRLVSRTVVDRGKVQEAAAKHLRLGAHRLHKGQHVPVAAEVTAEHELAGLAAGLDEPRIVQRLLMLPIHRHVRAAEGVDGLLGVSYRAQILHVGTSKVLHNGDLHGVGVLEFIHHDQAKLVLEPVVDLRHLQGTQGFPNQVVVVQQGMLPLCLGKGPIRFPGKAHELV